MALLTFGPETPADDEQKIADGYKLHWGLFYAGGPFVLAYYVTDVKWLIAAGLAAILYNLHECGGRLYDLCIRLRRTNILLSTARRSE